MPGSSDVSRIHGMYSVTLLAPSSKARSLTYSLLAAAALVAVSVWGFVPEQDIGIVLLMTFAVMASTQALDSRMIRGRHYSKALHMSLYSNMLWTVTMLASLIPATLLPGAGTPAAYIGMGMFAAASFRFGLLTSVLGVGVKGAWGVCLVQPVAAFLVIVPYDMWPSLISDVPTLALGVALMALATVWSLLTDRAGRPNLGSTHSLIQAYIYSREDMLDIESVLEERSRESEVSTSQLRFRTDGAARDVRVVLPEIHPGPFHPVGGSNISFQIYRTLGSSAMVMHSISDHALNIPSGRQVKHYLDSLSKTSLSGGGSSCTEPVTVQINKARVMGLRFGKSALMFLSLSPHGMEDLPIYVKKEIEAYSGSRDYGKVMIVDCHNAMGREISDNDSADMLKAARSCLDSLATKEDRPFRFGYANSADTDIRAPELAMGGLAVLCLGIGDKRYLLGWADSNNMENGVREYVVEELAARGHNLVEISTSDTHFAQGPVRTKQGYYHFGAVTPKEKIAEWYLRLAGRASDDLAPGSFEILENRIRIKVMGPRVFKDFNLALDRCFRLSKIFMAAGVSVFLISLLV